MQVSPLTGYNANLDSSKRPAVFYINIIESGVHGCFGAHLYLGKQAAVFPIYLCK